MKEYMNKNQKQKTRNEMKAQPQDYNPVQLYSYICFLNEDWVDKVLRDSSEACSLWVCLGGQIELSAVFTWWEKKKKTTKKEQEIKVTEPAGRVCIKLTSSAASRKKCALCLHLTCF